MSTELATVLGNEELMSALIVKFRKDGIISRLGDGDMMQITEAGSVKRGFKVKVELKCPEHFIFIGDKPMLLVEGYDKINQYCGIEIFDANKGANPYERDSNGRVVGVNLRRIGVGYSPTGRLIAVDQPLHVDTSQLLIEAIQAKIKKYPHIGMLGSQSEKPTQITYYKSEWKNNNGKSFKEFDTEPTKIEATGVWVFFSAFEGGIGYWVNTAHPEILEAFNGVIQKQRFMERAAMSISRRLILGAHPAIATKTPVITSHDGKVATGYVIAYGFTDKEDPKKKRAEMEAMADRVAAGEDAADCGVIQNPQHDAVEDAEMVDPAASGLAGPGEVSLEEPAQEEQEESAPAQEPETPETSPEEEALPWPEYLKKLMTKENQKALEAARKDVSIGTWEELRTAPPEIVSDFMKCFHARGGKG